MVKSDARHDPAVVAIIEDGEVIYSRDGTTCKGCLVWKAHVLCGRVTCPLCGRVFSQLGNAGQKVQCPAILERGACCELGTWHVDLPCDFERAAFDLHHFLTVRGICPSEHLCKSIAETAEKYGVTIDRVAEAISDSVLGEHDRMKEIGGGQYQFGQYRFPPNP